MAIKFVKDFDAGCFSKDFGFTGSAKGTDAPKSHPTMVSQSEYGDNGSHVAKLARGGRAHKPRMMKPEPAMKSGHKLSVDPQTAQNVVQGALRLGAAAGAKAVLSKVSGAQSPAPMAPAVNPSAPAVMPATGAPAMRKGGKVKMAEGGRATTPRKEYGADYPTKPPANGGYKKGGFVSGAIKHPGRETRRAQEHGVSVHDQMVRDSHSKDPSLRGAGALGLRLTKGDLHRGKKKG